MVSTTGTSIENYLSWVKNEIEKKDFGEVSIVFTICNSQIVDVEKGSKDKDHFQLKKKGE
jgi:hypothetical protein